MQDAKHCTPVLTSEERTRAGKNAGIVGILVNLFLFGIKLFGGILAKSEAKRS